MYADLTLYPHFGHPYPIAVTPSPSIRRLYAVFSFPPHTGQRSLSVYLSEREYVMSKVKRFPSIPTRLMRPEVVPRGDSFSETSLQRAPSDG